MRAVPTDEPLEGDEEYPFTEHDLPHRREVFCIDDIDRWMPSHAKPMDQYQALMEARPMQEPVSSVLENYALRELLAEAIDRLDPDEMFVFNATIVEQVSFRKIARQMGTSKSRVHRIKWDVINKLRESLKDHPLVLARLGEQVD